MKIFNFELEEKLDQNFDVKFDGESTLDSFEAEKLSDDPLSDLKYKAQKFSPPKKFSQFKKILNFELEET